TAARSIDLAPSRSREQPALRVLRNAVARPLLYGREKSLAERVLGARDIPAAARENGDQPPVRSSPGQLPAIHATPRVRAQAGLRSPRRRATGSVPPIRAPCRGSELRSRGSRRAPLSCLRTDRLARGACRPANGASSPCPRARDRLRRSARLPR